MGSNIASASAGARVIGFSSIWGGGDADSSFGANKSIDGDSGTAWSSAGDGDDAWIEIELSQEYELFAIGLQTRTMGDSAQISSFSVITDNGAQLGPFDLADAATVYYFEVDARTKKLRFEVDNSSGGNTGVVEIEVYAK